MMKSFGWSVVVAGKWNPAILNPAGIKSKLFQLNDETDLQVQVPLDGYSPYRVGLPDGNLFVLADENRIVIDLADRSYETLAEGMSVAKRALESLPETPVVAAGWNINFKTDEVPAKISKIVSAEIDDDFSDNNWNIDSRSFGRSFFWGEGIINMTLIRSMEDCTVKLNFHKSSKSSNELKVWLQTPMEEVKEQVDKLLDTLDLKFTEEEDNDTNDES